MQPFKLSYPVRPWLPGQNFGDCHPSVCHIYRDQLGLRGHNGIDARAIHGQNVYAAHDGIVTFAGEDGSAGMGVVIRTHEKHAYQSGITYFKSIYWHLQKDGIKVRAGQHVKTGDLIAFADNTGLSSGDHLHFGVKPVFKGEEDWEWWNLEQENGFKGAIDPAPYFTGKYADERPMKPSERIAVMAAQAEGTHDKSAAALWLVVAFLKSFGT